MTSRLHAWLRRIFAGFAEEVEEEAKESLQEDADRACHDPFRFDSYASFQAHRSRHGKKTRGSHPRYPW